MRSLVPGLATYVYQMLLRPAFRGRAEGFSTGTTVAAMPRDAVEGLKVVMPPNELLQALEGQLGPIGELQTSNMAENATLAELRDTLLPRLISGKLRIPDAEKLLAEAPV